MPEQAVRRRKLDPLDETAPTMRLVDPLVDAATSRSGPYATYRSLSGPSAEGPHRDSTDLDCPSTPQMRARVAPCSLPQRRRDQAGHG